MPNSLQPNIAQHFENLRTNSPLSEEELEAFKNEINTIDFCHLLLPVLDYFFDPQYNYVDFPQSRELINYIVTRIQTVKIDPNKMPDRELLFFTLLNASNNPEIRNPNKRYIGSFIAGFEETLNTMGDNACILVYFLDEILEEKGKPLPLSLQFILAIITINRIHEIDPLRAKKLVSNYEASSSCNLRILAGLLYEDGIVVKADIEKAQQHYEFALNNYRDDKYRCLSGRLLALSQSKPDVEMFNSYKKDTDELLTDHDPLLFAITYRREKSLITLLKEFNPNRHLKIRPTTEKVDLYTTPLLHALETAYLKGVDLLVAHPDIGIDNTKKISEKHSQSGKREEEYTVPLLFVQSHDYPKIVLQLLQKLLFQAQANPYINVLTSSRLSGKQMFFSTPLLTAIAFGNVDVIRMLLNSPKSPARIDKTSVMEVNYRSAPRITHLPCKETLYTTPLFSALSQYLFNLDIIKMLLTQFEMDLNSLVLSNINLFGTKIYRTPLAIALDGSVTHYKATVLDIFLSHPQFNPKQLSTLLFNMFDPPELQKFKNICHAILRVNPFLLPILVKSLSKNIEAAPEHIKNQLTDFTISAFRSAKMKSFRQKMKMELSDFIVAIYQAAHIMLADECRDEEGNNFIMPIEMRYVIANILVHEKFPSFLDRKNFLQTVKAIECNAIFYRYEARVSLFSQQIVDHLSTEVMPDEQTKKTVRDDINAICHYLEKQRTHNSPAIVNVADEASAKRIAEKINTTQDHQPRVLCKLINSSLGLNVKTSILNEVITASKKDKPSAGSNYFFMFAPARITPPISLSENISQNTTSSIATPVLS